jgi:Ca2+-transporting ATPase
LYISEAVANLIFPFLSPKIILDAPKLLWINLVTDGLPAVAFGVDAVPEKLIYERPDSFRLLLTSKMRNILIYIGIATGIMIALILLISLKLFSFEEAVTIIFTTLIFSELFKVLIVRYFFNEPWFSNKWMIGAMILSAILQVILVYSPLGKLFGAVPIYGYGLLLIGISLIVMFCINLSITYFVKRDYY